MVDCASAVNDCSVPASVVMTSAVSVMDTTVPVTVCTGGSGGTADGSWAGARETGRRTSRLRIQGSGPTRRVDRDVFATGASSRSPSL
jgi:hypothetical protein